CSARGSAAVLPPGAGARHEEGGGGRGGPARLGSCAGGLRGRRCPGGRGKWSLPDWIPFVGGLGTDGAGDSHECGPGDQAPPLSVPEDRLRWCCEAKGVWCPLVAMPTTTTERPFDCRALTSEAARQAPRGRSAGDALKRLWCCQYEGVGCPKETTGRPPLRPRRTTAARVWPTGRGELVGAEEEVVLRARRPWLRGRRGGRGGAQWDDHSRRRASGGLPSAASCDVQCTVKDFSAPCQEWVHLGVQQESEFASEANPCARARDLVARECPQCAACDLDALCGAEPASTDGHAAEGGDPADAGNLNATATPAAASSGKYDCHGAGPSDDKSLWPEDDQKAWCCEHHLVACFGCGVKCVVEGVSATCAERVAWSKDNQFSDRQDACSVAHDQVSEDCPVCSGCELGEACPGPNATASDGAPGANATGPRAPSGVETVADGTSTEATSTQVPAITEAASTSTTTIYHHRFHLR
ncbi:unnamed protein product, partial [Prorocentrum cordatum]